MLSRGLAVRDANGKPVRVAGSQTDVTARRRAEEQLSYDALHDSLTGLSNRVLFRDRLEHVLLLAKRRQDYSFAVLFIDLDRFKVINDSLGHLAGDQLLISIAHRIKACIRERYVIDYSTRMVGVAGSLYSDASMARTVSPRSGFAD